MISSLQKLRLQYEPKLPTIFSTNGGRVQPVEKRHSRQTNINEKIRECFPKLVDSPILQFSGVSDEKSTAMNVGVIFSGGQAPGGHNVIAGIFDGLKSLNANNKLIGFHGGSTGLLTNDYTELTEAKIAGFRNTGGFDMIGSGRTKLETVEQFEIVRENCERQKITAIIIIGGDDSNTNACLLAEYFLKINANINVVGCPKTIDGDLKNEWIETSFGFDTACKVYSGLVGNICRDAISARKYWHFIKLMGRSASHIALECALQTHPDIVVISEEVSDQALTLEQIVDNFCSTIMRRANLGLDFGIALIPEGLIEFIPEMDKLISELNDRLASSPSHQQSFAAASDLAELMALGLSADSARVYFSLPPQMRSELVLDRDPHGNVQVAKIETEKMLINKVIDRLANLAEEGKYRGKFLAQSHYLGYEGRCAVPTNFDANYCYSLGFTAAALLGCGCTGYLASIKNTVRPVSEWIPVGVPLTLMMDIELRHGKNKPVIKKALVNLEDKPFKQFRSEREKWASSDDYVFPGPIQLFGPPELCNEPTMTLKLERDSHVCK